MTPKSNLAPKTSSSCADRLELACLGVDYHWIRDASDNQKSNDSTA